MLVLSRRTNQKIVLNTTDGPIKLTVVRIGGGQVRLGIEAPAEVHVVRSELIEADRQ